MAHFVIAPIKFDVTVAHEGPEMVIYTNSENGFELDVSFQPIGGSIRGTLITEVFGERINTVVCALLRSRSREPLFGHYCVGNFREIRRGFAR